MLNEKSWLREEQISWIREFASIVTDCIFIMRVEKDQTYRFIYEYVNKPAMELARITRRDIGRSILESNFSGNGEYIQERYLKVITSQQKVSYTDNVILPNGHYEARTQLIPIYNDNQKISYVLGVTVNVNQLSEKSDNIKYLNRLFSIYMDTTDNGVALIDFSGKFIMINEAFLKLFGYQKADLLKMNLKDFQPHIREKFLTYFNLLQQGERILGIELDLLTKDKQTLYTTISFTPIPDEKGEFVAFAAIVDNITDEIKTKQELTFTKDRYRLIAENTQDLVSIIDKNGIIQYASPSHTTILEYSPEELVGNVVIDYMHLEDKKLFMDDLYKAVEMDESTKLSFRLRKKSGEDLWVETNIKPVRNEESSIVRIVTTSRDITKRIEASNQLKQFAFTDYLTGLPNRREFIDVIVNEKEQVDQKQAERMAVFYIDGDGFKEINDTCGHEVGDKFLVKIGERLKGAMRKEDFVARIGGDEFSLLMKNVKNVDQVKYMAGNIIQIMKEPIQIDSVVFNTTVSIGISIYPDDDNDIDRIMQKADKALYQAKRHGKNTFYCYGEIK
ncbi:sensor domain-containing protein [Virgibacillus ndiopensis]|uniref:sensor domain-containing protein n=1 Tax=Virgibacillus ndiopensis TaxID=2004408 RepID=UPI000C06E0D9|nr:diguanylate cyclase [Virgibacillus ndiopensis]